MNLDSWAVYSEILFRRLPGIWWPAADGSLTNINVEKFFNAAPEVYAVFGQGPAMAFATVVDPLDLFVSTGDRSVEFFSVIDRHTPIFVTVCQQQGLMNACRLLNRRSSF